MCVAGSGSIHDWDQSRGRPVEGEPGTTAPSALAAQMPRHYRRDRESSKWRAKRTHNVARWRHGRTLGRIGLATH